MLIEEMIRYYSGDPQRIQHFLKVYSFARLIGHSERADEYTMNILEAAAVVHDVGIKVCEEKYGRCDGQLQEKEGPGIARRMLSDAGYSEEITDRVAYLVGHHHTYSNIDGIDYRILVEADFLVNLYEENSPKSAVSSALDSVFETKSGKRICRRMFDV